MSMKSYFTVLLVLLAALCIEVSGDVFSQADRDGSGSLSRSEVSFFANCFHLSYKGQ